MHHLPPILACLALLLPLLVLAILLWKPRQRHATAPASEDPHPASSWNWNRRAAYLVRRAARRRRYRELMAAAFLGKRASA